MSSGYSTLSGTGTAAALNPSEASARPPLPTTASPIGGGGGSGGGGSLLSSEATTLLFSRNSIDGGRQSRCGRGTESRPKIH